MFLYRFYICFYTFYIGYYRFYIGCYRFASRWFLVSSLSSLYPVSFSNAVSNNQVPSDPSEVRRLRHPFLLFKNPFE